MSLLVPGSGVQTAPNEVGGFEVRQKLFANTQTPRPKRRPQMHTITISDQNTDETLTIAPYTPLRIVRDARHLVRGRERHA